jgi:hypothetical protein
VTRLGAVTSRQQGRQGDDRGNHRRHAFTDDHFVVGRVSARRSLMKAWRETPMRVASRSIADALPRCYLNACVGSRTPQSTTRWSIRQYRVRRRA